MGPPPEVRSRRSLPDARRRAPWVALAALAALAPIAGCKPSRGEETVDCTPGAHIWIGCNQACSIGECTGDPWLQICDGDTPVDECVDGEFIAESDDATDICFSTCPIVQMICPESGHVTVTLKGYTGRTNAFTCDWRIEEREPASLLDAGAPETDAGAPEMDAGAPDAGSDAESDAAVGAEPGTP